MVCHHFPAFMAIDIVAVEICFQFVTLSSKIKEASDCIDKNPQGNLQCYHAC